VVRIIGKWPGSNEICLPEERGGWGLGG